MARKGAASKPRKTKTRSAKARSVKARLSGAPERLSRLSIWSATASISSAPALNKNVRADVCVVGAGIAGLTTAYLLASEGKSVVVVEKNKVGQGETSHTSAHLSNEIDASYRKIESLHGAKGLLSSPEIVKSRIGQTDSALLTRYLQPSLIIFRLVTRRSAYSPPPDFFSSASFSSLSSRIFVPVNVTLCPTCFPRSTALLRSP